MTLARGIIWQTAGMEQAQEYVVGFGTLALINAGLAQSKNRSGLNWFVLSLFLGPIATFLLVAHFGKRPDPPPSRFPLRTD
jgi:hypothetical protein